MKKASKIILALFCLISIMGCTTKEEPKEKTETPKTTQSEVELDDLAKEVIVSFDKTLELKGLHLVSEHTQEGTIDSIKEGAVISTQQNDNTYTVTADIDNANPLKPHYIVKRNSEELGLVFGEEDDRFYQYLRQADGTYEKQQDGLQDKKVTVKNAFLRAYLPYDMLKETAPYFSILKEKEIDSIRYTLKLHDTEAFRQYHNKKNHTMGDVNADYSALHSYQLIVVVKDGTLSSLTSDMEYERELLQDENDKVDYDHYKTKEHSYTAFQQKGETIHVNLADYA